MSELSVVLPPSPSPEAARAPLYGGLPAPLTSFVGREREVTALRRLLLREEIRHVALTGPGGIGKTRLALRAASEVAPRFRDGVVFVPLAAVRSPLLLAPAIAEALSLEDDGRPVDAQLVDRLRPCRMLLLLDNMEQLAAGASLLTALLEACPELTLLVTSRVRLRVSGVHDVAVPPLPTPAPEEAGDAAAAAAYPAVRLFVDRARAASAAFALTTDNARAVAAICRHLDGIPLALELAAARTTILSPAALLARLSHRMRVLGDGPLDQPPRLRSMRDAVAWSYDLLDPEGQTLFRWLAVFVGGFSLEAVEAVAEGAEGVPLRSGGAACGSGGGGGGGTGRRSPSSRPLPPEGAQRSAPPPSPERSAPPSVLGALTALLDASLVRRVDDVCGAPRFAMLETIREFGQEALAANGDGAAAHDGHAAWCVAFAEQAEPGLRGPEQDAWVRRIDAELANVRAAHAWLAERGDAVSALRLAGALGWYWCSADHFREAHALFAQVLAMPGGEAAPAALLKALTSAGDVANWVGDQETAGGSYERALALCRGLGDDRGAVGLVRALGNVAIDCGDLARAETLLAESLALAEAVGEAWEAATSANLLGVVAFARGDYAAALARHAEAAAGWERLGDHGHVTTALASHAWAAFASGNLATAGRSFRSVLERSLAAPDELNALAALTGAAMLAARRGDGPRAAGLFGAVAGERERLGIVPLRPALREIYDGAVAATGEALGAAAFAEILAAGRTRPLAEAVADAAAVLGDDRASPPVTGRSDPYGLTRREREVLRVLARGASDKEIAAALYIERPTASKHVASILAKLGVSTRAAAVALAAREGLA